MDVHARDVVTSLVEGGAVDATDFSWQAQLRSYWAPPSVSVHMLLYCISMPSSAASVTHQGQYV